MAITTRDQLISAIAASTRQRFSKIGTAQVAATFHSFWRTSGQPASAPAGPAAGVGAALTSASAGALMIPGPLATSYLSGFDACSNAAGTLMLCDRIAHWGVDAAVATSQAMGAVTLPARATALRDIELWIEIETGLGATQTGTITIGYTDQDNNAASAGVGQFAASSLAGRNQPVAIAAGDTGVKSVTSVQLAVATTGKFNIVLRRVICTMPFFQVGDSRNLGWPETDLEVVGDNACLELMWLPNGTGSPTVMGGYSLAQG